jgi:hypothetical protein
LQLLSLFHAYGEAAARLEGNFQSCSQLKMLFRFLPPRRHEPFACEPAQNGGAAPADTPVD